MNKKTLKRIISIGVFLIVIGAVATIYLTDSNSSKDDGNDEISGTIPVYTPGAGGILYILNAGLTSMVNNTGDLEDANLATEAVNGSDEILSLSLEKGKLEEPFLASIAEPSLYKVYEGTYDDFPGEHPDLRSVAKTGDTSIHLIVPDSSPIKTYEDLKGKTIGVNPGSAQETFLIDLLEEVYDFQEKDDYKFIPLGYEEVKQGLQDKSIDVGVLMGATPAPLVKETAQTTNVRIISIGDKEQELMKKAYPYYHYTNIDSETYKNQDTDITVGSFDTITYSHKSIPDEVVYNYIKPIVENHDEFSEIHASAKDINKDTITKDLLVPLHPGVEKYYEEHDLVE